MSATPSLSTLPELRDPPTTTDPREAGESFVKQRVLAGRYRLEERLAEGGMGVVMRATHLELDAPVAIKILRPDFARDEQVVSLLLSEAKVVASLRGKHINRVLDVGRTEAGEPFLVLEYLSGSDLSQHLTRAGCLPLQLAVDCVLQACEGLAEAHALGIVHRDLKPDNLFLSEESDGGLLIKVLDFGICKTPAYTAPTTSDARGDIMGTPDYMAPEQVVAGGCVDSRSDIWALGVVLHELCTGTVPFTGATLDELLTSIVKEPPGSLAAANPDLPPGLQEVVSTCLEKDPAKRYQSVVLLARALAPFASDASQADAVAKVSNATRARVESRRSAVEQLSVVRPSALSLAPSTSSLTPTVPVPTPGRPKRVIAAAIMVAALGLAGFVSLQTWQTRGAAPVAAGMAAAPSPALPAPAPVTPIAVSPVIAQAPLEAPVSSAAPTKKKPAQGRPIAPPSRSGAVGALSPAPQISAPPPSAAVAGASRAAATPDPWSRKSFGGRR